MGEANEVPPLPGEVWRAPDGSCAVTLVNGVSPFTWIEGKDGLVPTTGNVMPAIILGVWAMAERAEKGVALSLAETAQKREAAAVVDLADITKSRDGWERLTREAEADLDKIAALAGRRAHEVTVEAVARVVAELEEFRAVARGRT